MIRFSNIATFLILFVCVGTFGIAQPTLTHVNSVNAAGNATLHWEVFISQAGEEFVHNEIKVFDTNWNILSPQPHIVGPNTDTGVLPTG